MAKFWASGKDSDGRQVVDNTQGSTRWDGIDSSAYDAVTNRGWGAITTYERGDDGKVDSRSGRFFAPKPKK